MSNWLGTKSTGIKRCDKLSKCRLYKRPSRPLSMVDCLLRLVLDDAQLKIDRFATYNVGDFHDICGARTIEMVS